MENNKTYIISEYLNGTLTHSEKAEFDLQMLEDVELREAFLHESHVRSVFAEANRLKELQAAQESAIKATILAAMRKVEKEAARKKIHVFEEVLEFKTPKVISPETLRIAYLYANLIAYQAIEIQKRRFAFVQASMRGIMARGVNNDKPKTLEIDKSSIEKTLEPVVFKADSEQVFPIFNTFDFKIYFSLVEISDGVATFLYPYHENIQNFDFDISDAECFWLDPNECMPLTVGIDEGTFDVEILYAKEPFHFRPKQSVPVAEYKAWKQTHANKIVFVKDGMRYIGEK